MMRRLYNIGILLSVLFISLIACNKDKESTMMPNTESEVYWSEDDVKIQNQILDFQDKIKNNSFKDGEMMSVDDVIWNIEALLNYNYSNPVQGYTKLTIDTNFTIDITVENGMVNYNDIIDAAFAMEERLLNFYNQIPDTDKFILGADVSIRDNGFKNGSKSLTLSSGYGSEYVVNPGMYTPFGENDYWAYGRGYTGDGGYCDGIYQGLPEYDSTDAAEEIEKKINYPNQTEILPRDAYYTNYKTVMDMFYEGSADYTYDMRVNYRNPNDQGEPDGSLDYLTLWVEWYYDCISPEEMNFYMQGNLDIIESERQKLNSVTGKDFDFRYIDLIGKYFYGPTTIPAKITYAEMHIRVPHD